MTPNGHPEPRGLQNPELGAAPESHGVVIQDRRHDQGPIEDGGQQDGVLELRELVAEAAVRSVPQKPLARTQRLCGAAFRECRVRV